MGLDLIFDEEDFRVGTYSGVHDVRIELARAAVEYLSDLIKRNGQDIKDLPEHDVYRQAVETISSWLSFENDILQFRFVMPGFDGSHVRRDNADAVTSLGLDGLRHWIIHSDCDGSLTVDQSRALSCAISLLLPWLPPDKLEYYAEFGEFLDTAVRRGATVDFA